MHGHRSVFRMSTRIIMKVKARQTPSRKLPTKLLLMGSKRHHHWLGQVRKFSWWILLLLWRAHRVIRVRWGFSSRSCSVHDNNPDGWSPGKRQGWRNARFCRSKWDGGAWDHHDHSSGRASWRISSSECPEQCQSSRGCKSRGNFVLSYFLRTIHQIGSCPLLLNKWFDCTVCWVTVVTGSFVHL